MDSSVINLQKTIEKKNQHCSISLLRKKTYFCYNKFWGIRLPNIT